MHRSSFIAAFFQLLLSTSRAFENNNMQFASLRQRLLNGGKTYGPLIMSDSPIITEMMARIGYGHILIDLEHSPTDLRSCQNLLQAFDAGVAACSNARHPRTEPLVRLASPNDQVAMKKVLDSLRLPGGVLVPMVEDSKTAEQVVRSTRYPRQQQQTDLEHYDNGFRGCAVPFVRASGWSLDQTNDEYVRQCQEDMLVMVQVESPKGVETIGEIAAVDGIDLIFLGPFDLSCSIGKMGDFQDKDVQDLLAKAEEAVKLSPCLLGGFRPPGRSLNDMFADGYSLVCGSVDIGLLREAARLDAQNGNDAMIASSVDGD